MRLRAAFTMTRSLAVLLILGCLPTLQSAFQVYPTAFKSRRASCDLMRTNQNDDRTGSLQSKTNEDDYTASTLTSPSGQQITLIGTAHLSQKSNAQVERLLNEIRPNVVMIELDPDRLGRIGVEGGMESIQEGVDKVATVEDIELPMKEKEIPWFVQPIQNAVQSAFSTIARKMLTGMYDEMSNEMNSTGGGEFLVAIETAKNLTECHTLVLGDRDSVETLKRVAQLALQGGKPLGVVSRFMDTNEAEMTELEGRVRAKMEEEAGGEPVENGAVRVSMMETLKKDSQIRNRIFDSLEREVPEFTQAFIKERDFLMAESIRRELSAPNVERVVGVIGLGHLPGMLENLEAMFANEPVPLQTADIAS